MLTNEEKVPYRRLEPAVQKFIKVAIPTDLDRLRSHQLNIEKYRRSRSWGLLHKEQINAGRTVQQLRSNILEMDTLFLRVKKEDITTLTNALNPVKDLARAAIAEFLEHQSTSPGSPDDECTLELQDWATTAKIASGSNDYNSSEMCYTQMEMPQDQNATESWNALEKDLLEVNRLVNEFSQLVHTQQEKIDCIDDHINTAAVNVEEGTKNLGKAVKFKLAVIPAAGALIGGIVGGPIGLIAGLKVAGIATALGGVLGFTGGKYIQRKKEVLLEENASSEIHNQKDKMLT
ncbi:syntaxin-17 [Spea bombifrons]|uniref:syntaxin-17 n=1 Tax=Spea bombifrons TaxID=233779 RepID=UPI0023493076|nr:syntaxin-17 [Spea bombifrons]